jgi:hypothetical protein
MRAAWPTAELVHLPIHASWLNQVEISSPSFSARSSSLLTSPTWTDWPDDC